MPFETFVHERSQTTSPVLTCTSLLHPPPNFFYAPNFLEVEGAYCFGPQSVCPLHLLLVVKLENPLSLQKIEILYVASVQKISKHIFFFAVRPSLAKLCPLCRFCAIKAVAPPPPTPATFFFRIRLYHMLYHV